MFTLLLEQSPLFQREVRVKVRKRLKKERQQRNENGEEKRDTAEGKRDIIMTGFSDKEHYY